YGLIDVALIDTTAGDTRSKMSGSDSLQDRCPSARAMAPAHPYASKSDKADHHARLRRRRRDVLGLMLISPSDGIHRERPTFVDAGQSLANGLGTVNAALPGAASFLVCGPSPLLRLREPTRCSRDGFPRQATRHSESVDRDERSPGADRPLGL